MTRSIGAHISREEYEPGHGMDTRDDQEQHADRRHVSVLGVDVRNVCAVRVIDRGCAPKSAWEEDPIRE